MTTQENFKEVLNRPARAPKKNFAVLTIRFLPNLSGLVNLDDKIELFLKSFEHKVGLSLLDSSEGP